MTPSEVIEAMVTTFNTGDVSDVAGVVHSEYLDHQGLDGERPIHGPDGFVHVVQVARAAYANLKVTIVDVIESGDRVAARIIWDGVRSSGEIQRRETIDIIRIADGKATEHWGGESS